MNGRNKKSRISAWLVVGVLVLIALLLIWLTVADLFGDTDVAAKAAVAVPQLLNGAFSPLLPLS